MLTKQLNAFMRVQRLLLCCLVMAASLPAVCAAADDIRVLIDVSGSMVKTDPHNLRKPAMRMLNGLIPSGSQAGVWTFGRYVTMVVKVGKVDDGWRKLADQGVEQVHSLSQFTNIESALERASSDWGRADASSNRNIILLTDGKVDISKQQLKSEQSREEILSKRIPDLKAKGVRVHAIALSNNADEALLQRLAVETGGSFEIAHNAKDLQRIFLHMFERATKPDSIPLQGNEFSVDDSISEMTLLVFRKTDKKVRLIQPDRQVHGEASHGPNVRWRNDQGYALITVKKPVSGRWQLDADVDDDNRVMIVTDLKLKVHDLPAYSTPDEALDFHVELHDRDQKISKNSFLKFVDFKLRQEFEGVGSDLPLELRQSRSVEDKGIYEHSLQPPLAEGVYQFEVSADARTFDRATRLTVEVQWPVTVKTEALDEVGHYQLVVTPREAFIKPDSLRLAVSMKRPDGSESPVPMALQGADWSGRLQANEQQGDHAVSIEFQAETQAGKKISKSIKGISVAGEIASKPASAPEEVPAAPEIITEEGDSQGADVQDDSSLMTNLIIIGASNGVLLLGGLGVFLFMRKRRSAIDVDLLGEEDEDVKDG
jgi:hypothetical protein